MSAIGDKLGNNTVIAMAYCRHWKENGFPESDLIEVYPATVKDRNKNEKTVAPAVENLLGLCRT